MGFASMNRFVISALKVSGIAILYSALGVLLCKTARTCLWEPFLHLHDDDGIRAWPLFVRYYDVLVFVVTLLVAFLAARSYRPHFATGGVLTGVSASLLFRFVERTQYSPGREPDMFSTFLAASLFGLILGLLGSISGLPRKPNKAPSR